MPGKQAGFTLIEVLVVLAILGLGIGLVAARGPATSPALEARSAAQAIARALRLARSQALMQNARVAFTLDPARHAYRAGDGAWQALPASLALQIQPAHGDPPPPGRPGSIVFTPEGGATGGQIRITAGAAALAVAVDWLSGHVAIADGGTLDAP